LLTLIRHSRILAPRTFSATGELNLELHAATAPGWHVLMEIIYLQQPITVAKKRI